MTEYRVSVTQTRKVIKRIEANSLADAINKVVDSIEESEWKVQMDAYATVAPPHPRILPVEG